METPARLRLYQYEQSPYCIPIELMLRHSGIPYEIVNLEAGDPTPVIHLTKGDYYQVPVLEDLFNHRAIYDKSAAGDDVPRYIVAQAPLMNLFPQKLAGWQRILIAYVENECEPFGFKVNDAHRDKWLKNDVERALHRRHKERKFGEGCLDEWTRDVGRLTEKFYSAIQPFEQLLGQHPFLTGDQPVYADYSLCGVVGNFLFSGVTLLPPHFLMLEAWYTKMRAGNFRNPLDDIHLGTLDISGTQSDVPGRTQVDLTDLDKAVVDLKLRPGSHVLDVPTGHGEAAVYLAGRGFNVIAADTSPSLLKEAGRLAAEKHLTIIFHEHGPEQLPYGDGTFSLVVCRGAAHHLKAPQSFIVEATRVLKTYGFLIIIDGTVPDDHVEANAWMNSVERLRDPSHVLFITPNVWRKWCVQAGLTVTRAQVDSFKEPDLNHYFNEANTPPENRKKILEFIARAPASARELFKIGQENGKIVFTWRRITLIAGKM